MDDPGPNISLDQLEVLRAVVQQGSFSAAARHLRRAQSAVSQTIHALERGLGVSLFDRATRRPTLTAEGRAILAEAETVLFSVGKLRSRAASIASGVEAEVTLAVDVILPVEPLLSALRGFQDRYPLVTLKLSTEALGMVGELVRQGRANIGLSGPVFGAEGDLAATPLTDVLMVPVVSRDHPLASRRGLDKAVLRDSVQIVLSDRSTATDGIDYNVFSARTWRVADLATKLTLIRKGFGWGQMPSHLIDEDLRAKALVVLDIADLRGADLVVSFVALQSIVRPPGPAGRWLLEALVASFSDS